MSYKLFLDDERTPNACINYMQHRADCRIYVDESSWVIVRNYSQFCNHIIMNGIPDLISFDHDLADAVQLPETETEFDKIQRERTGLDCAKFLCHYFENKIQNAKFPECIVHSANPVGAENIRAYIENFKKHVLSPSAQLKAHVAKGGKLKDFKKENDSV